MDYNLAHGHNEFPSARLVMNVTLFRDNRKTHSLLDNKPTKSNVDSLNISVGQLRNYYDLSLKLSWQCPAKVMT